MGKLLRMWAIVALLAASVAADVTIYVGGTSASATNGGCGDSSLSVSQVVGADGAPVDSGTGASVTNNGSNFVRLTLASAFDDAVVGAWVYVDFATTDYTDGRYEITDVDVYNQSYVDLDLAYYVDASTNAFAVGGAVPESELENIFDCIGYPSDPVAQSEQVFVKWYDGGDGHTRSTTWGIDVGGGDAEFGRYLIGCDSSYEELPDGQRARLISAVAGGYMVRIYSTAGGQHFRHVMFDGANTSTSVVMLESPRNSFYDCEFANGTQHGLYAGASYNAYVNCIAHDNASDGMYLGTASAVQVVGCRLYDNGGDGLQTASTQAQIVDNVAYGNTGKGFYFWYGSYCGTVVNNTAYDNGSDGFYLDANALQVTLLNCTAVSNGGYGFNFTLGNLYRHTRNVFGWNHAYGNTSGNTNLSGTWADLGIGYNITGDPLFTDPANGDFRPQAGSPLTNAGIHGTTIGAREPVYSSGGGLLSPIVVGN